MVVAEILLQRFPAQQLHHEIGLPFPLAHVVDGADVGMVQGGDCPGLAEEALTGVLDAGARSGRRWGAGGRVPDQVAVGDELESDFAFEAGIERAIDFTHASGADLLDHCVGSKDSARTDHSRPKAFGFISP